MDDNILDDAQRLGIRRIIKSFCREENVTLQDIINPSLTFFFVPQTKCVPLQCLRALNQKYKELLPWKVHLSVRGVGYQCLSFEQVDDEDVGCFLNKPIKKDLILSERAKINTFSTLHKFCDLLYFPGDSNQYVLYLQYVYKKNNNNSGGATNSVVIYCRCCLALLIVVGLVVLLLFLLLGNNFGVYNRPTLKKSAL